MNPSKLLFLSPFLPTVFILCDDFDSTGPTIEFTENRNNHSIGANVSQKEAMENFPVQHDYQRPTIIVTSENYIKRHTYHAIYQFAE